jgi:hypothetical protein
VWIWRPSTLRNSRLLDLAPFNGKALRDFWIWHPLSWLKSFEICEFGALSHFLRVSKFVHLAPLNGKELLDFWIWRRLSWPKSFDFWIWHPFHGSIVSKFVDLAPFNAKEL